jgi:hypothetical protein
MTASSDGSPRLIIGGSNPIGSKQLFIKRVTSLGFLLFGTAMFLLLLAVLDLVVLAAFGGAPIGPVVPIPKSEAVQI